MTNPSEKFDENRDLALTRVLSVPRETLWKGWTRPEHLTRWFCPAPWKVTDCEIDLRPGGVFRTEMRGPGGEGHATDGCYLEVRENEKLVWTLSLTAGFRPAANPFIAMTAIVTFEDMPDGKVKFTARVLHADAATRQKHADMGFEQGWGAALDQLVAIAGEIA